MLRLFNIISAVIAFVICVASQRTICNEYSMVVFFPIIYLILSSLLMTVLRQKKMSVYRTTGSLLIGLQWIRGVLSPAIGCFCGFYGDIGSRINSVDATTAVWMMLYEMIVVFLCAIFIIRFSGLETDSFSGEEMTLSGDAKLYSIFILFAIALMIITRTVPFQFIALSSGTTTRLALEQNDNLALETIIMYGLTFFVVVVIAAMHKRFILSNRETYLNIALAAIVLRVALISSESRLALVYQIGTGLMLMSKLFPKQKKKIVRVLLVTAIAVIGLLTVYKVFYAFLYSSYLEAISSRSNFGLLDISTQLDAYFYGIKTVARNLTYVHSSSDASISTWLMDIVRNTFGIHYLVRSNTITTIEAYNLFIYGGRSTSGYLFSSLAYGSMYYSYIFAPAATIINFCLACYMEKRIRSIRYIEIYYIMCLVYVRFAVSQFAVFSSTWNYVSRTILIGMVVIGFASIGRIGSRKKIVIGHRQYNR